MKLVFFGSSSHVLPIIEALRSNFDLKLVVTTEKNNTDAVVAYCTQQNIPYKSVGQITPTDIEEIKKANATVGALASFGLLIPNELLHVFPYGIVNIHPSLLPAYRGPTPVQTAILEDGDKTTGVTLIKLDDQLDHGPILTQVEEKISPNDTSETLYKRLFIIGAKLLVESLPKYIDGSLETQEQDHNKATFTDHLTKKSGFVDIKNPPSKTTLNNMIKAYYPWPGVWTRLQFGDKEKIVKLLPDNIVQVEGKKPMRIKDFLNGYPQLANDLKKLLNSK